MAGLSVTAGTRTGSTHGTGYSTNNLQGMEIDAIANISAKGGRGSTIEAIVKALQPVMWVSTGTAGKIFAIVHGHAQTAASMQTRLQAMGTVDGVDLSSATVTARDLDGFVAT